MTPEFEKRAHVSLIGVWALFFCIFSGLFCGFLIAYFFPDEVVQALYGVSTEPPPVPVTVAPDAAEGPPSDPADGEEGRERALSDLLLAQAAMEGPAPDGKNTTEQAANVAPRFIKRQKPPPPIVVPTPVLAGPAVTVSPAPAVVVVPPASAPTPPSTPPQAQAPTPSQAQTPPQAPAPPQAPPPPPAPPPGRASLPSGYTFASFLLAAQYPAAEWRKVEAGAGFVDAVTIAATGEKLGAITPGPTDMIDVAGWAGDGTLGMRIKDVVFSMCGKIVGHAPVGLARPDVAKAVHPNLAPSGWQARFYVGYLPRCPGSALQALAITPGTVSVMPVGDPIPISLPAEAKLPANAPAGALAFTPRSVVPAKFGPVDVLADNVELRRCGSSDCPVVGQLAKARHEAIVAEETQDGWVLLILRDKAGWLPRAQILWSR